MKLLLPVLLAVLSAAPIAAQTCEDCLGGAGCVDYGSPVVSPVGSLMVTPDGAGPTLAEVDLVIRVQLKNTCGELVQGYPYQDLWIAPLGEFMFSYCSSSPLTADYNTDSEGWTQFTGNFAGGGSGHTDLHVFIAGAPFIEPIPITVVSPDINGDLVVNVSDVVLFAQDWAGSYNLRSDFQADGRINLLDVTTMANNLGAMCE